MAEEGAQIDGTFVPLRLRLEKRLAHGDRSAGTGRRRLSFDGRAIYCDNVFREPQEQ
jgi:hypothetical protein